MDTHKSPRAPSIKSCLCTLPYGLARHNLQGTSSLLARAQILGRRTKSHWLVASLSGLGIRTRRAGHQVRRCLGADQVYFRSATRLTFSLCLSLSSSDGASSTLLYARSAHLCHLMGALVALLKKRRAPHGAARAARQQCTASRNKSGARPAHAPAGGPRDSRIFFADASADPKSLISIQPIIMTLMT